MFNSKTTSLFSEIFGERPLAPEKPDSTSEALDLLVAMEAHAFYKANGNSDAVRCLGSVIQKLTGSLCKRHG